MRTTRQQAADTESKRGPTAMQQVVEVPMSEEDVYFYGALRPRLPIRYRQYGPTATAATVEMVNLMMCERLPGAPRTIVVATSAGVAATIGATDGARSVRLRTGAPVRHWRDAGSTDDAW
ncbi:MAG: hypothetical protein U0587_20495 [Candidatus Binatia bacterium]